MDRFIDICDSTHVSENSCMFNRSIHLVLTALTLKCKWICKFIKKNWPWHSHLFSLFMVKGIQGAVLYELRKGSTSPNNQSYTCIRYSEITWWNMLCTEIFVICLTKHAIIRKHSPSFIRPCLGYYWNFNHKLSFFLHPHSHKQQEQTMPLLRRSNWT